MLIHRVKISNERVMIYNELLTMNSEDGREGLLMNYKFVSPSI